MMMLKRLFLLLSLLLFQPIFANAINYSNYYDCGGIYSNSLFPQSVSNLVNQNDEKVDISKLKRGESKSRNWFGLVERGNSGIDKAMRDGEITKIYFVDNKVDKVYVPYFFFLPIYVKQKTTIVYGE